MAGTNGTIVTFTSGDAIAGNNHVTSGLILQTGLNYGAGASTIIFRTRTAVGATNVPGSTNTVLTLDESNLATFTGGVSVAGTLTLGGTNITSTAAELNIIDGDTSATATTVASGDRVVYNDAGNMKQVDVDDINTYFSSTTNTLTNKTLTSPAINTSIIPASADGASLGTATLEWADLYLADGSVIYFGNDQDVTLTHNADKGLILKNTSTTGSNGVGCLLTLQTGDVDVTVGDVLGQIDFQAPNELGGIDAVKVAAGIAAVSEGTFSSSNNATKLSFKTASSDAATEQMSLSSAGNLTVTGNITTSAQLDVESYAAIGNGSDLSANSGLIIDYDTTYTGVGQQLLVKGTVTGVANTSFYGASIEPQSCNVPAGTTSLVASLRVKEPAITATGTLSTAATVYIEDAPTEGNNNYALFVDAGTTRLDGGLNLAGTEFSIDDSVVTTLTSSATFTNECKSRMALETTKNIIDFFENKIDKSMIVKI